MLQFIFEGKNYVGPFQEVMSGIKRRRPRILDLGTGGGLWFASCYVSRVIMNLCLDPCRACQIADEFPHADVVGVDIAPIQPL